MPRGDGTGPMGLGPFTGWGRSGNRPVRGRISRRGFCWTYDQDITVDKSVLQQEIDWLERRISCLKQGLESKQDKE